MSNTRDRRVDVFIDEVRQRRRDLFAACGEDLDVLTRLIRQQEADHPERVADPRTTRRTKPHPKG